MSLHRDIDLSMSIVCQNNIANIYQLQGRYDLAGDLYVAALDAGELAHANAIAEGASNSMLIDIQLQISDRQLNYAKLLLAMDHDSKALKILSLGIQQLAKIKGGPQIDIFERSLMMSVLRLQCYSGIAKIK